MRIEDFTATADLVGRRLRLAWTIVPESGESLADAPRQVLRRKTRDFAFPPVSGSDPWLVYDSTVFPPAPVPGAVAVEDLEPWEEVNGTEVTRYEAISVARTLGGGNFLEHQRRIVGTTYDAVRRPIRRRIEIVDAGPEPLTLPEDEAHYYELTAVGSEPLHAIATPGAPHGINRALWDMIPEVVRRHDVLVRPAGPGDTNVPEALRNKAGQLRRFIDAQGAMFDYLRSEVERLWTLRDVSRVDARMLPHIARWIGWRLGEGGPIPLERNEIDSAPRLYKAVGAPTALRALVTRYTGWETRLSEYAQSILRANDAPRRHLFAALEEAGGSWRGLLDVATVLGFGPGARSAFGAGTSHATLTGGAGPFALFPGATLQLSIDGGPRMTIRFGLEDFSDIGAATPTETAAAITRAVSRGLRADTPGGALRLSTESVGPDASLEVIAPPGEALTLDMPAEYPVGAALDGEGRLRLIGFRPVLLADPGDRDLPSANPALLVKTLAPEGWRATRPLPSQRPARRHAPAAASLADGTVMAAWLEQPAGGQPRLAAAILEAEPRRPAVLRGSQTEPFALAIGTHVTFITETGPHAFNIQAADYAAPNSAMAAEVAAALNAQLGGVLAAATQADGSLSVRTVMLGDMAELDVDLSQSTAARVLGFAGLPSERGSWDDNPLLRPIAEPPGLGGGGIKNLSACAAGLGARLAFSRHVLGRWRIGTMHWAGVTGFVATDAGLAVIARDGSVTTLTLADGLPGNDIRDIMPDANGGLWVATAAGVALRRADGVWLVFDAAAGLASDDARRIALSPDSAVWVATAGGVSRIVPGAPILTQRMADGLPSDDVRDIAVTATGVVWAATAAGCARHMAGAWTVFDAAGPLPSNDVRAITVGPDGATQTGAGLSSGAAEAVIYVGTASGLVMRDQAGGWNPVTLPDAAGADLRSAKLGSDGTLLVATGVGVHLRSARRVWTSWTGINGLPGAPREARFGGSLHVAQAKPAMPDVAVSVWVATAAGAAVIDTADGHIDLFTTAEGAPSNNVASTASAWSAVAERPAVSDGEMEPALLSGPSGADLAVFSRLLPGAGEDRRILVAQRFDPATHAWGPDIVLTTQPSGGRATDRQPAIVPAAGGAARILFTTDRTGAPDLAEFELSPADVPSPITAWAPVAEERTAPCPVILPGGALLLLFRSDANVALDQLSPELAGVHEHMATAHSRTATTLARMAGSPTVRPGHAARHAARRRWGDLLAFTPERPLGEGEAPLRPDSLFTRGTLGLHVTRGRGATAALTRANADRLRELLTEFVPINMRVVILLNPVITIENVYGPGFDLSDDYMDMTPFVEIPGGPVETFAVSLPDWSVLLSNDVTNLSVDPADLTTLRRRSFYPPPA